MSENFSTASQLLENQSTRPFVPAQQYMYKRAVLALRLDGRNDLFDEEKKVFVSHVQKGVSVKRLAFNSSCEDDLHARISNSRHESAWANAGGGAYRAQQ